MDEAVSQRAESRSRRRRLIPEVIVIASLVILPSIVANIQAVVDPEPRRSVLRSLSSASGLPTTIEFLGIIGAVLFVVSMTGDLPMLGLRFRPRVDLWLVIGLFAVWYVCASHQGWLKYARPKSEIGLVVLILGLVGVAISAISEELVFRCHLISRLTELLGNRWAAWGISSVLFGACHLYESWTSAGIILIEGAVVGLVFLLTKRSVTGMIVHATTNGLLFCLSCGYLRAH